MRIYEGYRSLENEIIIKFNLDDIHSYVATVKENGYFTVSGTNGDFTIDLLFKEKLIKALEDCGTSGLAREAADRITDHDSKFIMQALKDFDLPKLYDSIPSDLLPPPTLKDQLSSLIQKMEKGSISYDEVILELYKLNETMTN